MLKSFVTRNGKNECFDSQLNHVVFVTYYGGLERVSVKLVR